MTRTEATERKSRLERAIEELETQLLSADVNSASVSSSSGSKSYTNRSISDIKQKLAYAKTELAKLEAALGMRPDPTAIVHVRARFNG